MCRLEAIEGVSELTCVKPQASSKRSPFKRCTTTEPQVNCCAAYKVLMHSKIIVLLKLDGIFVQMSDMCLLDTRRLHLLVLHMLPKEEAIK